VTQRVDRGLTTEAILELAHSLALQELLDGWNDPRFHHTLLPITLDRTSRSIAPSGNAGIGPPRRAGVSTGKRNACRLPAIQDTITCAVLVT
jgi:hypothetical protein